MVSNPITQTAPQHTAQMRAATEALGRILGDDLEAVYLHGSAVSAGLRPQSDIDLLAIVGQSLTDHQRDELLRALLRLSGTHPKKPGRPRCIEVMVFHLSDLTEISFPPRADFVYGEWMRDALAAGQRPMPTRNHEHTLILAQARQEAMSLFGACAPELLPEIPFEQVTRAMKGSLPALLDSLPGDERNVLLTLARMWFTACTGQFITKDAAAAWAIPKIPDRDAAILDHARMAYRGEIVDEWGSRGGEAQRLAARLSDGITDLL